jgi:hypothetical protein
MLSFNRFVTRSGLVFLLLIAFLTSSSELGFDTYISKVGGYGVKWHGHTPPPAPASIMRVGRPQDRSAAAIVADPKSTPEPILERSVLQ